MPRSMVAFTSRTPDPIPAPGDFTLRKFEFNPFYMFPGESAANRIYATLHEYIGLADDYYRAHFSND